MKLLLVEDDALLADSLLELLRGEGYRVDYLSDGDTALARLATAGHGVDLVLPRSASSTAWSTSRARTEPPSPTLHRG